jgi:hypothetical protein
MRKDELKYKTLFGKYKIKIIKEGKSMSGKKSRYDWIVTPFPERISNHLPLPYPIAWLVISEMLFFLHFLVMSFCNKGHPSTQDIGKDAILPILLTLISTGIILFSKRMEDFTQAIKTFIDWPENKIMTWYSNLIRKAFSTKTMVVYGITLGVICVLASLSYLYKTNIPIDYIQISRLSLLFLVGLMGGAMFSSMLGIGQIISSLGNIEELKVSIYQHPSASVKAAGKLLFIISLYAAITYLVGLSYAFLPGFQFPKNEPQENFFIALILIGFGIFVIGYFIFPQIKIHDLMAKYKHKRVREFSKHLDNALEKVMGEPSRTNLEHVKELFEIQKELNGMGEWPFDTKFILTLISVIIIPILIALIQILLYKFL